MAREKLLNSSTPGRTAWGIGIATRAADGTILDAWYPSPRIGGSSGEVGPSIPSDLAMLIGPDDRRGVECELVTTNIDLDKAPISTPDAYLRLHLLSHLLVAPNSINLDGIFRELPNVVWTTAGPMQAETFTRERANLMRQGICARSLDKFPPLLDYVTPEGVRIADASRVRLGAHLAPGTTVMHEGFVNFNAGTLGTSMIEGRISQGVVVGEGSDVGGGASIMGTLSGGGTERVSIGARSLLGANSGIGISIGDDCIVEAGLYLTAGSKVAVLDDSPTTVKAAELSGRPGLLFRRNSLSGAIEAIPRAGQGVTLNAQLHA